MKMIWITGATDNLGGRLRRHLAGDYELGLLDIDAGGGPEVPPVDLHTWDPAWAHHLEGVDVVFHFALQRGTTWAAIRTCWRRYR